MLDVVNPATGDTVRRYGSITDADLRSAIRRADRAHVAWSHTEVESRAALIRRVGDLHGHNQDRLAEIVGREMGKPVTQALGEIDYAMRIYHYYADNAAALMEDEPIDLLRGEGFVRTHRKAGSVVARGPHSAPWSEAAEAGWTARLNTLLAEAVAQGMPDDLVLTLTATALTRFRDAQHAAAQSKKES